MSAHIKLKIRANFRKYSHFYCKKLLVDILKAASQSENENWAFFFLFKTTLSFSLFMNEILFESEESVVRE